MKLQAFVLAGALALSCSDSAVADDMSFVVGSVPLSPAVWAQTITHEFGSFEDTFSFQVSRTGAGTANAQLMVQPPAASAFQISNLSMTLWSQGTSLGTFTGNEIFGIQLADGDYVFHVAGNAVGAMGGEYGLAMQLVVVPEPQTWAMFAAGLGLLGSLARRRGP